MLVVRFAEREVPRTVVVGSGGICSAIVASAQSGAAGGGGDIVPLGPSGGGASANAFLPGCGGAGGNDQAASRCHPGDARVAPRGGGGGGRPGRAGRWTDAARFKKAFKTIRWQTILWLMELTCCG